MPCSEENILRGLDAAAIMKWQKNRYPAFFVDFIDEAVPGKSATGRKSFSTNEWFFQNRPDALVPEVIVSEALEQVFLMTFLTLPENRGGADDKHDLRFCGISFGGQSGGHAGNFGPPCALFTRSGARNRCRNRRKRNCLPGGVHRRCAVRYGCF